MVGFPSFFKLNNIPLHIYHIFTVSAAKWINLGDLMYSMVTIVNCTVLYTWNFLRHFKCSKTTKKVPLWGNGYVYQNLLTHVKYKQFSFVNYIQKAKNKSGGRGELGSAEFRDQIGLTRLNFLHHLACFSLFPTMILFICWKMVKAPYSLKSKIQPWRWQAYRA